MTFELYPNGVVQVIFKGVVEFICNAFGSQNIVLDMVIDTERLVPTKSLEKIYSRPAAMLDKHDALVERIQEQIQQGQLCFVELLPSCGCEAFILCQSVKFVSVEE